MSSSGRGCAQFFAVTKVCETNFQVALCVKFFNKTFSFVI